MTSTLHVCLRGGALVSGNGSIPDDPADYLWTAALKEVGCGRLHCQSCLQLVAAGALVDGGRAYRCGCTSFIAHTTLWLAGQPEDSPSGLAPSTWGCAGHAHRALPLTLDGTRVDATPDWRALLSASVQGGLTRGGPPWLPGYGNAWLERLVATVSDDEQGRFAAMVAGLVTDSDGALRMAGLDLAERLALGSVAAVFVRLVAAGTFDWGADEHLSRAAVEQLRRAIVALETANGTPDEALKLALRHALLSRAGGSQLIHLMAPYDADWLADNAARLSVGPRARNRLLNALAPHPEALTKAQSILNQ